MPLQGTYKNAEINSTLVIEKANDANGEASGYFEINNVKTQVKIHYHFVNSAGPVTNLCFSGFSGGNPNFYVGGAGRTNNRDYAVIELAGGYATPNDVIGIRRDYKRQ